jgi:hypothetical protein
MQKRNTTRHVASGFSVMSPDNIRIVESGVFCWVRAEVISEASEPLLMTPVYMRQIAKRVMFSDICSEVSVLLRRGVSAGT